MFVILSRVLPRATAEILIVVFDRDSRCYRYTRSKKRRCTETTTSSSDSSHLRFMLTFCVLGAQRGGRAIVIREEFVASAPLCVAIFSATEPGLLRRDNRMRSINHSTHLISAIVYIAPARARVAPIGDARAIKRPRSDATE